MRIKLAWVEDPKTKKQSVSLTNFVVAAMALLTVGGLNVAGVVKDTSIFLEYFTVSAVLYFGRNLNIGGKQYDIGQVAQEEQKEPGKEEA